MSHTADASAHIARARTYEHRCPPAEGSNEPPKTELYTLSPIDLSTLVELEDFLRGEPLDIVAPRLAGKPPMIQEVMINKALELGDKRRIGTVEFDRAVQSMTGMSYLLYLSLRARHPLTTPTDARRIFSEANGSGDIEKLSSSLINITGFRTGKDNGQAAQATPTMSLTANP